MLQTPGSGRRNPRAARPEDQNIEKLLVCEGEPLRAGNPPGRLSGARTELYFPATDSFSMRIDGLPWQPPPG